MSMLANVIKDWNLLHIFMEPWFWCSFLSWIVAQCIKLVRSALKTGKIDFEYLVSTGGMPSAHSSMVTGTMISVCLTEGFGTPIAMVTVALAGVTMFDAATVRRAAGEQAKVLNKIVQELKETKKFKSSNLKELLGHTQKEVYGGMVTGALVALTICYLWPK